MGIGAGEVGSTRDDRLYSKSVRFRAGPKNGSSRHTRPAAVAEQHAGMTANLNVVVHMALSVLEGARHNNGCEKKTGATVSCQLGHHTIQEVEPLCPV